MTRTKTKTRDIAPNFSRFVECECELCRRVWKFCAAIVFHGKKRIVCAQCRSAYWGCWRVAKGWRKESDDDPTEKLTQEEFAAWCLANPPLVDHARGPGRPWHDEPDEMEW